VRERERERARERERERERESMPVYHVWCGEPCVCMCVVFVCLCVCLFVCDLVLVQAKVPRDTSSSTAGQKQILKSQCRSTFHMKFAIESPHIR
jgi:hypothetical protein